MPIAELSSRLCGCLVLQVIRAKAISDVNCQNYNYQNDHCSNRLHLLAGSFCSFRSFYSLGTSLALVWILRYCSCLDYIVSSFPCHFSLNKWQHFRRFLSFMWCPQGSVLGPLLLLLYTTPLIHIVQASDISHHLFADDTQL